MITSKWLTAFFGSLLITVTTGCSSLHKTTHYNEWFKGQPAVTDSLQEPCISCGEDWIFIGNEPFAAQVQSVREQGYDGTNWDTTVRY
jgi:hypothetical protein